MIEVTNKMACCGCGACQQKCPVSCIEMREDNEGFLYPYVSEKEKCINCGACEIVCPIISGIGSFFETIVYEVPKAVGGWIKDEQIRYNSSSGGAFSLLAKYVLEKEGIVFGAAMCEDLVVRHIEVDDIQNLYQLRGSKYVQSSIGKVYQQVKKHLEDERFVLFSGTPCQAAGLRSFLGNGKYKKLYIVDFICHGVPSPKVFTNYIESLESKYNKKIVDFKFRLKDKKWNPSGLQLGTRIMLQTGKLVRNYPALMDPYMNGFLDDIYLRPSCYDCNFKDLPKTYSDITIADFWGVDKNYPELNDGKGTSLVLINGTHGLELFENSKDDFCYKQVDFNKAIRRNLSLIKSVDYNARREKFFYDYKRKTFKQIKLKYMNPFVWVLHKVISIIKNKIKIS